MTTGQRDDVEPGRRKDAVGTCQRIGHHVPSAMRIEIAGILVFHERRLARIEQIQRAGARHGGKLRNQCAQRGRRKMLDHLDADARIEGSPHIAQCADHILRIDRAVRQRRWIKFDGMEPVDHLRQQHPQRIEQPTGAGADVDEARAPARGNRRWSPPRAVSRDQSSVRAPRSIRCASIRPHSRSHRQPRCAPGSPDARTASRRCRSGNTPPRRQCDRAGLRPLRRPRSASGTPTKEPSERGQGDVRHVVLDPLGVLLGRFGWDADGQQQVHHQAVAGAHTIGQPFAGLGQEHAAIRLGDRQPLPLQAADRLDGGGVRTPRRRAMSVGRASPLLASRSEISST